MKLLLLAVLCVLPLCLGADIPFTDCGSTKFTVSKVTGSSWPPKAGSDEVVNVVGSVSEQITGGTYEAKVKFDGIQIDDLKGNIGDLVSLPIGPGAVNLQKDFPVPSTLPPGTIQITVTATDQDNNQIVCVQLETKVVNDMGGDEDRMPHERMGGDEDRRPHGRIGGDEDRQPHERMGGDEDRKPHERMGGDEDRKPHGRMGGDEDRQPHERMGGDEDRMPHGRMGGDEDRKPHERMGGDEDRMPHERDGGDEDESDDEDDSEDDFTGASKKLKILKNLITKMA